MSDTIKPELLRLANGRGWFGFLALDNFDLVVDRIKAMIGDGQPYTWVAANEAFDLRPEVRAGETVKDIRVNHSTPDDGEPMAHLSVDTTSWVWGLSTTAATQVDARDGGKFNHVYLHFEQDRSGLEKLTIEQFAPAGHRLCWVIACERCGGEGS